ncbi:carotenoid oxygenase family protein [Altericista sp. CCNU0014]|uniref:carotenoid oxygenase family protein n=1 Tax=Altericista sp. CCNU0014 TaxID=3082949 RepID=UPI00384AA435
MTLSAQKPQQLSKPTAWGNAFVRPLQDFPLTPLEPISGRVPLALRGSLYRNGPAIFERGGERIAHWFDGDGAVLGVHFGEGAATGVYRTVRTAGYLAEEEAGQFLLGGYGRRMPGPFWTGSDRTKNAANTSVLALENRLLALWEGGHPHALDLQTLETIGVDDLGKLETGETFSAHPKVDPQTGEIYNFGVTFGRQTYLHLYRCDRAGKMLRRGKLPLKSIPMIHDFVLAGPYLVFCIAPVALNPLPLLLHWQSYSEAMRWQPDKGTQILVLDRDTFECIGQSEADPWFQWHFGNGFVDRDGQVAIDLVRYADFQTNRFLQEVPSGQPQTDAPGHLWQMRIDPKTAKLSGAERLSDRTCEFPTVSPALVGQPSRYTYLSVRSSKSQGTDLFDAIAVFDRDRGELSVADLGDRCYPSEPIFAPNPEDSERGWILTVVYEGDRHSSEVWIFESQALERGPICRLALPQPVAFSFHGTWRPTQS